MDSPGHPPHFMPLEPSVTKIFGIGLSRTGSKSLTKALHLLGYDARHFPVDRVTQREYRDYFEHPRDRLQLNLLRSADAVTDNPVSRVYPALDVAYPGSKFVLTTRAKDDWLRSCEQWWATAINPFVVDDWTGVSGPFMTLVTTVVYGTPRFDRDRFAATYDQHLSQVADYFRGREKDLLVMDICAGDGWPQLAPFLRKKIPDTPFPHLNPAGSPI
jgi:hypothetical protein